MRLLFKESAVRVFTEILGIALPDTIVINMVLNDHDEISGKSSARLASFNSELSNTDNLIFTIHEKSVKNILDQNGITLLDFCAILQKDRDEDNMLLYCIKF